jgi:hypothetical protein
MGLLLVCLATAGCARSDDRAEATGVAERFFSAISAGDGAAACAQLSPETRKKLEQDEQKPCREAIGGPRIEPGALEGVEVFSTNAKADLANGDSAFLSLTKAGWRLSAAGCKPAEGSPSDVPMDCEIEA